MPLLAATRARYFLTPVACIRNKERDLIRTIRGLLEEASVCYLVAETLLRGIDFYSTTAFEFGGRVSEARA